MTVDRCSIIGGGLIATAGAFALDRLGCAVTVVTRAPPPLRKRGLAWRYGDVTSASARDAVSNVQSVIYAAGTLEPATKLDSTHGAIADEVIPVVQLAEQAAMAGARTFVFISSGGTVYGPHASLPTKETERTAPINMYGTLKLLTEQALIEVGRQRGITIVILRVTNPYGPGQSGMRRPGFVAAAVKCAIAGEPIVIWGDGSATRDFIHIDDVGAALAAASRYRDNSAIINIGSGRECSLLEVCSIVSRHSRRPLDIHFDRGRAFDVPRSCLDITNAATMLRWRPTIDLENGIAGMMNG